MKINRAELKGGQLHVSSFERVFVYVCFHVVYFFLSTYTQRNVKSNALSNW